ncbi:MAG: hypothetical protein RL510_368 [Actinomycetota bacterium]|jgi:hypothetical protein
MSRFTRKKSASTTPTKQVKLKLVQVEFWSAVRMGFWVNLGLAIAIIVGFIAFWFVLSSSAVNSLLSQVGVGDGGSLISLPQMISYGAIVGIINIVAGTVLWGVLALVYNAIAKLTGGLAVGFTNNN